MGVIFTCDAGCGALGPASEFEAIGLARELHYCAACAPSVRGVYERLDVLHTELVRRFGEEHQKLIDEWQEGHSDGSLPDVGLPPEVIDVGPEESADAGAG